MRLKTLRHPSVLKFIDGTEDDQAVYVVTERVSGLDLQDSKHTVQLPLGLFQVAVGVFV